MHQAVSTNLGDRTAAWLYDRLTDACVRPPGMGHLEDPDADQRPGRRARLRPRHDRPAAVDLHGLHRRRHGPDRRRIRLRAGPVRIRLVGADRPGRRVAGDPLAASRERRSGRIATRKKCAPRSAMPTTPTGWRWTHRRARNCGSSVWRTGRSTASSRAGPVFTICSTRRHACARSRCCGASLLVVVANVVVFWSLASAAADGRHHARAGRRVRPERRRGVDDRVRRPQLGARRGRGARRGGAASRAGDADRRRAAVGRSHGRAERRRARFASAISRFGYPGGRRCSTTSTCRSRPDRRSPSSARTAPARRRWPSCCAVCTIRTPGAIEIDGVDVRDVRSRVVAFARDGGVPGLHPPRAAASRQRRAGRRA